jgi:WD40 repeat protein
MKFTFLKYRLLHGNWMAWCLVLFGMGAQSVQAADFSDIEPLLQQHCVECHSSKEPEGGLDLESYDGIKKGGETGVALVAGRSGDSLLVRALQGDWGKTGKNQFMPPGKRERLKPEQVSIFKAWIDAGAPGPKPGALRREISVPAIQPKGVVRQGVQALAHEPRSKWLAVARGSTIEWMNSQTRQVVRRSTGSRGLVNALVFAPDGQSLYSVSGQPGQFGEIRRWKTSDGSLQQTWEGHRDAIYAVAISPDGQKLATGGYDYLIQLWDLKEGKAGLALTANQGAITALSFRVDGKLIASTSFDRTAKLFHVSSGERLETFGEALKELNSAVFTTDGTRLLTGGGDNRIRVYGIGAEGKEGSNELKSAVFAHEGAILRLIVSANGRHLASAGDDRAVKLYDIGSIKQRFVLELQPDWPTSLAFVGDDQTLVVGRIDGSLGYYRVSDGKPAEPPRPDLVRSEPRGIQLGTTTSLRLVGRSMESVNAVLLYRGTELMSALAPERRGEEVWVTLSPPREYRRGPMELSVSSPAGESGRIKLWVDDLPQLQAVTGLPSSPAAVWGVLKHGTQVDDYVLEATARQTLIFDVQARELGSKANLSLELLDAGGRTIASNDDYAGHEDPFLAHTFATAGRFKIRVTEQTWQGSAEDHFYRLTAGSLPFITGLFPLALPSNRSSRVQLLGHNLASDGVLEVTTGDAGELGLPETVSRVRSRREWKWLVTDTPGVAEVEPNDAGVSPQVISTPGAVDGRFSSDSSGGDIDVFAFVAHQGQRFVIEAIAASRGSPADTRLEVLRPDGKPVERMRFQAVRNSAITFRNETSEDTGIRFENWEEMELNDLIYSNGEVMKILRAPQGPDSDTLLYSAGGKRRGFFDTTPTSHPLDQPVYVVESLAPGALPVPNGLPVFSVPFENDDDSERRLGTDARLYFVAPADGTYWVRLSDARGFVGPNLVYRLTVRPQAPDISISLAGANPTVAKGSGQGFSVTLVRRDGFDGAVRVDLNHIPRGWTATTPLVIEAGHETAFGSLSAAEDSSQPSDVDWDAVTVVASAEIDGRPMAMAINNFGRPKQSVEKAKLMLTVEPMGEGDSGAKKAESAEIVIVPGTTVRAKLTVVRNGFDGAVRFEAMNLPHGVIVDNLGLNGITLLQGETERELFLTCARWVADQDRWFHLEETAVGRQASRPVLLKVRRAAMQAKAP